MRLPPYAPSPSIQSYKVTDLGLGQVGVSTGQAFASLEYMLEFYFDKPFPEATPTAVSLQYMHQHIVGLSGPDTEFGTMPVSPHRLVSRRQEPNGSGRPSNAPEGGGMRD